MASLFKKLFRKKRRPKRKGHPHLDKVEKKLKKMGGRFKEGFNLKTINEHSAWIRWGLTIFVIFLAAEITTRILGNIIRPVHNGALTRSTPRSGRNRPTGDFQSIRNRNMFNVEGVIPPPWDTGMLDCLSQAKPSSRRIGLLGTIVMKNPKYSTALLDVGGKKEAVRVDDAFANGKYLAKEIKRNKVCFQVQSSQDLEYVEIKDGIPTLSVSSNPSLTRGSGATGINIVGENQIEIEKNFLQDKLNNLNEILKTARAVPNIGATGKMEGFLIQSIQPDSLFYDLGMRQGDVLTQVNDINLDNAGKGLEAFQTLKNSESIALEVIRGGRKQTLNFFVK